MSKTKPRVCPPRLLLMSKHSVGEEIDKNDPSLPKEIQYLVKEERVHKIVHYDKTETPGVLYGSYERLSN